MVVLSCAICTKGGKALLARQFVELSKVRIEGLLAAFPKLMGTGKQHTFIETDTVRYLYQPLESLYILLVTNKNSNILDDLETLHLLAKLVPEYCHVLEEAEISKYAFELIFAFDEVIAMGYKERVTLQQVKHFTTMESHEEERARIELKHQMDAARKNAQLKQKELDRKRADEKKSGLHPHGAIGGGNPIPGGSTGYESPQPYVDKREKDSTSARQPALSAAPKGMSLSAKTSKKNALSQLLKEETGVEKEEDLEAVVSGAPPPSISTPTSEYVHISAEEKLTVTMKNDGALQSMEIQGLLNIIINDANQPKVKVTLKTGDNNQFQLKLHPNMDKNAFSNDSVLKLKDGAKGIPTPVMKWRMQTSDESLLPINISCWPSASSDGHETQVTLEYEALAKMDLHNVTITIPVPGQSPPVVTKVEGQYEWDGKGRNLLWRLPLIDSTNNQGSLEFTASTPSSKGFFPLHVSFSGSDTFYSAEVEEVVLEDNNNPVKFSQSRSLSVDQFEIL